MPYQFRAQPGQIQRRSDGSIQSIFIPGTIYDDALQAGGEPPKYVEVYLTPADVAALPDEALAEEYAEQLGIIIELKTRDLHALWAAEIPAREVPLPEEFSLDAIASMIGAGGVINALTHEELETSPPLAPDAPAMSSQLVALGVKPE